MPLEPFLRAATVAIALYGGLPAMAPGAVAQDADAPVVAVNLTNLTMADFTIVEAGIDGGHWLGNAPQQGQSLPSYEADLIRAQSEGGTGQSGFIVLSGKGASITLRWTLDSQGKLGARFAGNDKVNVHAVQVANLPHIAFTLVDRR